MTFLPTFAQKPNTNKLKSIDKEIEQLLEDWKVPGVAIAVVNKDEILYTKGFGYANLEKKTLVDANTLFDIGSCTKAFTATLLGQMQYLGDVDFDKPVTRYLPKLEFYNDELNNGVTIKDLITHQTGIARHDYLWELFPAATQDSMLAKIKHMKPSAHLREKAIYNNVMYGVQGAIIEQLTDSTWEENLHAKIFKPLGMERTVSNRKDFFESQNYSLAYGKYGFNPRGTNGHDAFAKDCTSRGYCKFS